MALTNENVVNYGGHILFAGDGHEITSNDRTVNVTQDGINFDLSVQHSIDIAKEYTDEKVEELDNSLSIVSKSGDYNDLSNKPEIPSIEGLATKEELEEVEGKIPSIDGLATKEELGEVESKIPDVSNFATKDEIPTDFYTKGEADTRFALKGDVPTDVYTKTESNNLFQPKGDYALKSDIPSIDGLATKEELEEVEGKIPSIEGLATTTYVNQQVGSGVNSAIQAATSMVNGARSEAISRDDAVKAEFNGKLATKQDKGDYALKSEIPSIEGLATKEELGEVEGKIPDVSNFATKDEIPSIEGLASEGYVDERIQEVESKIPSIEGLATTEDVTTAKNQAISSAVSAASQMVSSLSNTMQQAMDSKDNQVKAELNAKINAKQDTLVSGTSIKTINGESVLGEGNLVIQGGGTTYEQGEGIIIEGNVISTDNQELTEAQVNALNSGITAGKVSTFNGKQDKLVSGTSIKTINSTSLLGSGNISVQPTLTSGTNIKTINNQSILGSGNIQLQTSIEHDDTLNGNGTTSDQLSVNSIGIVGDAPQKVEYKEEDSKVHIGIDVESLGSTLGIDGLVKKSGDTMNGKLTISGVAGGDPSKSNEGLFVATINNSANKTGVSSNGSIFAGDFDNTNSQFLGIRRKIGSSKIAGRYQIYADGLPAFLQVDYTNSATIKALFQYGWNPTDGTFNWGTVSDNTTTKHIVFQEDIVREKVNVQTGISIAPQTALLADAFELSKDGYAPIAVSLFCSGGYGEGINVPQRYKVVDNKVVTDGSLYLHNTSTTHTTNNSTLHAYITWMKV